MPEPIDPTATVFQPTEAQSTVRPEGPAKPLQPTARGATDRYKPVRLCAIGGLGEVLLAEDVELNRQVALKRMRSDAVVGKGAARRFLREAEMTARLQHPGIIPVYGMSVDNDGRPAYAMRLVEGETLADAIRRFHTNPQFRSLAFRELLQRFVDVCQAVGYAHSRGVVHRDLKPGNIMLGRFGETYVVDWGLARTVDRTEAERIEGEETLHVSADQTGDSTRMGAAVGTPAYMSPEQAAGRWDVLGSTADVYGLGAMLYNLLTGRAPIQDDTWPAMQQRIQRGERPPARQVNPAAPRPLEAICNKAMTLEPNDRYASAQDLAADVQRWLADEPVTTDREPWTERARRWARRNRPLVAGLSAAVLAGLIVAAVGAGMLARSNHQLSDANRQLSDANRETRQAVDEFFTEVSENPQLLKKEPGTQELRKALLQRAREYYERFLARWGDDPSVRVETGAACHRLAWVLHELAPGPPARQMYERARTIRGQLASQAPADMTRLRDLATTENDFGALLVELGHTADALVLLESARAGREKVVAAHSDRPQDARVLAQTLTNIGYVHHALGQLADGLAASRAAVAILERLVRDHPADADGAFELGCALNNTAMMEWASSQAPAAFATVGKARAVHGKLAAEHPSRSEFARELAKSINNQANMLAAANRLEDARRQYEQAREIQERLARDNPDAVEYLEAVASTYNNLGALLTKLGNLPESVAAFRRALELQEELARKHSDVPTYTLAVARAYNNLGVVNRKRGEPAKALADLERARALEEKLVGDNPKIAEQAEYAELAAATFVNLGHALLEVGRHPEAFAAFQAAVARHERFVRDNSNSPARLGDLARVLGSASLSAPDADPYAVRAINLLRQAASQDFIELVKFSKDPDLEPLRRRADYLDLLWDLADGPQPAKP
jgi:serine/threonine-protein kinase